MLEQEWVISSGVCNVLSVSAGFPPGALVFLHSPIPCHLGKLNIQEPAKIQT